MLDENMKNLKLSAVRALEEYLEVKQKEKVLLVFDKTTKDIATAFELAAKELNLSITLHEIEPTGGHAREPDDKTAALMKKYPVVIAPTQYSLTHTKATINARKAGARVATLPGVNSVVFEKGLKSDPNKLEIAGHVWMNILNGNHKVRVVTEAGTDITFLIGNYPVFNDSGCFFEAGFGGNLPAGEVFLAPNPGTGQGIIVVDGTIGGQPWDKYSPPAKLTIENGSIISFDGERGQSLKETLEKAGPGAMKIAEFGIGTNLHLEMTGNLLGDEKVVGTIHFAFGNNESMGGNNDVKVHIDCLLLQPDILIDNKQMMHRGKWLINK
ncbi:MAG: aminopeptidase [Victivallales bacterium]|jgi:leucyl aminopeptidase (aminopeptidase T)